MVVLDELAELGGDFAGELIAGEADDDVLDWTDRHGDASLSIVVLPEPGLAPVGDRRAVRM